MIYFIRAAEPVGLIKIGCSSMPHQRLAALILWTPVALTIDATADGTWSDETALHAMFADEHSHGEWFRPSPRLNKLIADLQAGSSLPEFSGVVHISKRPSRALATAKQSVLIRVTAAEKAVHNTYAPVRFHRRPDFRPEHVHSALERWSCTTDTTALTAERSTILAYVDELRAVNAKPVVQARVAA